MGADERDGLNVFSGGGGGGRVAADTDDLAVFGSHGEGYLDGLVALSTEVATARAIAEGATGANYGNDLFPGLLTMVGGNNTFVGKIVADLVGGGGLAGLMFNGPGLHCGLDAIGEGDLLTEAEIAAMTPQEVRDYYEHRALCLLGTTNAAWQPGDGFDANQETVEGVVDFYADLYKADPETYLWAGMASMIWASLYAGVQDLDDIGTAGDVIDKIGEIERMMPGGSPLGPLTELTGEQLAAEMEWYERELLEMQKEVFLDQAVTHLAHIEGGLPAVEKLLELDPHLHGPETLRAWELIDEGQQTGDRSLILAGSEQLLFREQHWVLQNDYDEMRSHHGPIGEAMTYLMTMTGAPSIPGATGYADNYPVVVGTSVTIPVPFAPDIRIGTEVTTPLPNGNIADPDDRWKLIAEDTLPTYLTLSEDPDLVLEILEIPVEDRAQEFRILWQLDDIIQRFELGASLELVD